MTDADYIKKLEADLAQAQLHNEVLRGALIEALPHCDRNCCDKPALYEQTSSGNTWTECEEHADESLKLQPQYYLRFPKSKAALSLPASKLLEVVEQMRGALVAAQRDLEQTRESHGDCGNYPKQVVEFRIDEALHAHDTTFGRGR